MHVEPGTGGGRFQGDHDAVSGAWPVARWQAGQVIADRHTLRVPPTARPGTYQVYAGLWSPSKKRNLRVTGGAGDPLDRVRVGTITIAR